MKEDNKKGVLRATGLLVLAVIMAIMSVVVLFKYQPRYTRTYQINYFSNGTSEQQNEKQEQSKIKKENKVFQPHP